MPRRQMELVRGGVHGSNSCLAKESKPVYPKESGPTNRLRDNSRWWTKAKNENVAEGKESTAVPIQLLIRVANYRTPILHGQGVKGCHNTLPQSLLSMPREGVVEEA
jgi:hypothetical protein